MVRTWLASLLALTLLVGLVPGPGTPGAAAQPETSETDMPEPGSDAPDVTETETTFAIHLLLEQGGLGPYLVPVERTVDGTEAVATAAVTALFEGPRDDEAAAQPSLSTAIPDGVTLNAISIADGLATVDVSAGFEAGGGSFSMLARLAQLVYTVTQFPTVDGIALELDGVPVTVFSGEGIVVTPPLTRAAFDGAGVLPPVYVETPMYAGRFEARLTGTSAVGTFAVVVLDGDGRVLGRDRVSLGAVDGRVPFDVTVPYVSLNAQFAVVTVEDETDTQGSLREYPVTALPTPVPTARSIAAACPPGEVPGAGFTDVAAGTTHAAAIDCIAWRGVTQGRTPTTYAPAGTITRGQLASMLARTLETTGATLPTDPDASFPDTAGTTHELAIGQLTDLGIVAGRADGTYGPNVAVNRAQMASLLMRTFTFTAGFELEADLRYFDDVAPGSTHAANIDAAALTGLSAGVEPGRFAPGAELRRDQMASFVARLLDLLVVEAGATLTS